MVSAAQTALSRANAAATSITTRKLDTNDSAKARASSAYRSGPTASGTRASASFGAS
jgi:hypothetical protein